MSQEQSSTASMATTPVLSNLTTLNNTYTQHKLSASPSRPSHTLSPIPLHPGSKSPTSIPSSPTSIRSASSAIFERDIEPLMLPHPHHSHPHRTPRSTQIEQTVPSVLTEAAAALASIETGQSAAEGISILTPQAPSPSYGLALGMGLLISPNGQPFSTAFSGPNSTGSTGIRTPAGLGSQSRSPSPSRATSTSTSVSSPVPSAMSKKTPAASPIPSPLAVTSSLPSVPILPVSHGAPRHHHHHHHSNTTPPSSYCPPTMQVSPSLRASHQFGDSGSHVEGTSTVLPSSLLHIDPSSLPPAPSRQTLSATNPDSAPSKRLSFISYSDILYSNPVATFPLSSLTSSAMVTPPPHLPAVTNNVPIVLHSPTGGTSSRPLSMYSSTTRTGKQSYPSPIYAGDYVSPSDDGGSRRHSVLTQSEDITQRLIDDLGGEWEREGLGKGLEERLEGVTITSS